MVNNMSDKAEFYPSEWKLKESRKDYNVYVNQAGLLKIKCKHCTFIIISDKAYSDLAFSRIVEHINIVHGKTDE